MLQVLKLPKNRPKIVRSSRKAAKVDETIAQMEAEEAATANAPSS